MSEETSYEKLTRFADKTAAKYEERGYKVKVYKLPRIKAGKVDHQSRW